MRRELCRKMAVVNGLNSNEKKYAREEDNQN